MVDMPWQQANLAAQNPAERAAVLDKLRIGDKIFRYVTRTSAIFVLLLLGGASFLLGYHPTIGTILLVIFLLGVTVKIHNFWTISDPMARMNEQVHFGKNVAMIGFLLMTLMIFRPWPFSLG